MCCCAALVGGCFILALNYMLSTSVLCVTLSLQRASRTSKQDGIPQVCQLLVIMTWRGMSRSQFKLHRVCCLALVASCISAKVHLPKQGCDLSYA